MSNSSIRCEEARRDASPRDEAQVVEPSPFPSGSVRDLLTSDHVSAPTRQALQSRLDEKISPRPRCLTPDALATLRAVCARLVPCDDLGESVDIAGRIDQRLDSGATDGWRFATLPPDKDAWLAGLDAIEAVSQERFARSFVELAAVQQDQLLRDIQGGDVPREIWNRVEPSIFFEEMLAEAVETFYAHPLAQEDIGYVGMADLPAWTEVGLGTLNDREPRRRETLIG